MARIYTYIFFDYVCDELRIRDRVSTENAFKMFHAQPNQLISNGDDICFTNVIQTKTSKCSQNEFFIIIKFINKIFL